MSDSLLDAVILITSSQPENRSFGTGFPFYREGQTTYIATCAHVVTDVVADFVMINEKAQASVVAIGSEGSIDVAVLCTTELSEKALLRLRVGGEEGKLFSSAGFQLPPRAKRYQLKPLSGTFVKRTHEIGITDGKVIITWDLQIKDEYYQLQSGNSGSPVVDESGFVIGIVSNRQGEGNRGTAISIEHLQEIWPAMPLDLLKQKPILTVKNPILSPQSKVVGENIPQEPQSRLQPTMMQASQNQSLPHRRPVVPGSAPVVQPDSSHSKDVVGSDLPMSVRQTRRLEPDSTKSSVLPHRTAETTSEKLAATMPPQPALPQTREVPPALQPAQAPRKNPSQSVQQQAAASRPIDMPTLQKKVVIPFQIIGGLGLIGLITYIVPAVRNALPPWASSAWIIFLVLFIGGGLTSVLLEEMSPEKFAKVMTGTAMTGFILFFGGGFIGLVIDIVRAAQGHSPDWWIWTITFCALFVGSLFASLMSVFDPTSDYR